jgi:site-specific DNA recombinase
MKRYATYRRVSEITATNIEGSMNDQRYRCQGHIRQADGIFIRDYEEAGKSAYNERSLDKRSAYQQMLHDAKAGMFDVVLVYKYDRFSRRTRIALQVRYELEQAGVQVESVSEPFDTRTAAGRFGVRQMLSVAELFSDMLSERLLMARASEAARGRHVGPVPVGYIKQGGKGQIAPVAPFDALVIQACTLFAPGQFSPGRIAGTLNDAGYSMPNGRPLIAQDVRRIAQNAQIYAGYVRSAGVWIRGNHSPIIDDDLCQRVLFALGRRSVAQDRRFVGTQDTTALLAGLIYCEQCRQDGREAKMHYNADKRKNAPYRRYRCKTNADGGHVVQAQH